MPRLPDHHLQEDESLSGSILEWNHRILSENAFGLMRGFFGSPAFAGMTSDRDVAAFWDQLPFRCPVNLVIVTSGKTPFGLRLGDEEFDERRKSGRLVRTLAYSGMPSACREPARFGSSN